MKRDYAREFKELVEKNGYVLLSEYTGDKTKVKIRCNNGHEYKVIPNSFKRGKRCSKCSNKCSTQAKEQFLKLLTKEDYELLSEYKKALIKVKIRCNEGHEYKVTPNSFKSGKRCPICSGKCPIQAKEQFLKLLVKEGYELLSEYKGIKIKVEMRCDKGHEYSVRPNDFKNGHSRCPVCSGQCPIQAKEQFIELLTQERYKLLSEYKGVMKKVKIKCPEGHEYKVIPSSFKRGSRCPVCAGHISQKEINILNYVKSNINEEVISGDRTQIINPRTGNYLELDIWIPELNKAIEFNGTYWHSDEYSKYKDSIKKEYCEENGIDLMVIDEIEYDNGLELCLDKIDNFLG